MTRAPKRSRTLLLGFLAVAGVSCVPTYFLLVLAGGLLSKAEQDYWNAHRTLVRYELPTGFRGKGEIDFNDPSGEPMSWEGKAIVFRIPPSGRLRLRTSYEAVPLYQDRVVVQAGRRLPVRRANGDDEDKGALPPVGVGFYDRMNDDANSANHFDDANRQAFFVGTQEEFARLVKAGKIKAWE